MTTATATITIQCACGRNGKVPAHLAGRKVRCTGCSQYLRVVAPADAAPARDTRPAPPAPGGLDLLPEVERATPEWTPPPRRAPRGLARGGGGLEPRGARDGNRDPAWERHLRAIAFWDILGGGLGLLACVVLGIMVAGAGGGVVPLAVPFVVAGLTTALGCFLWCYDGVARLVHVALTGLHVALGLYKLAGSSGAESVVALLGLIWPVAVVLVLLHARSAAICTPEYRGWVARTRSVPARWWTSPFFTIPVLLFLVACMLLGLALCAAALR